MPQPQTVVLFVLLLATLVMPVSYRAGADHAHAHTIFQGVIDAIVGHPHHHHGEAVAETSPAKPVSPFAPAAIPLSLHADVGAAHNPGAVPHSELDPPEQLGMSTPVSAFAAIQALGLLVAALVTAVTDRPIWRETHRLQPRTIGVEIPPPRPA